MFQWPTRLILSVLEAIALLAAPAGAAASSIAEASTAGTEASAV